MYAIVYICGMASNTRINEDVLQRVKDYVAMTGQTAAAFINIAVTEKLDAIQGKRSAKTAYFSQMGDFLMQEYKKKKK